VPGDQEEPSLAANSASASINPAKDGNRAEEKDTEKQVLQNLERFIQRIRMVAH